MTQKELARIGRATYHIGRILYELKELSLEVPEAEGRREDIEDAAWQAGKVLDSLRQLAKERKGL
jgi:hypothetical protein